MRVAIATEDGRVAQHFGRCTHYTLAEIEGDKVVERKVIDNPGHEPGFLPRFLNEKGVECIIAGGMGQRAKNLFDATGITTVVGVSGPVDDVLGAYVQGKLSGDDSYCDHH